MHKMLLKQNIIKGLNIGNLSMKKLLINHRNREKLLKKKTKEFKICNLKLKS